MTNPDDPIDFLERRKNEGRNRIRDLENQALDIAEEIEVLEEQIDDLHADQEVVRGDYGLTQQDLEEIAAEERAKRKKDSCWALRGQV